MTASQESRQPPEEVRATSPDLSIPETSGTSHNIARASEDVLDMLETGIGQLRIHMVSNLAHRDTLEQECESLREERNDLRTQNNLLQAQHDASVSQLENAEDRNAQLEAEGNNVRQQAEATEAALTHMRAKCQQLQQRNTASAATITRLQARLNDLQQQDVPSVTKVRNVEENFAGEIAQALMSRRVELPPNRFVMTTTTGHRGPNRNIYRNFNEINLGLWVDLNGEVAWVMVYLVSQTPRILAT